VPIASNSPVVSAGKTENARRSVKGPTAATTVTTCKTWGVSKRATQGRKNEQMQGLQNKRDSVRTRLSTWGTSLITLIHETCCVMGRPTQNGKANSTDSIINLPHSRRDLTRVYGRSAYDSCMKRPTAHLSAQDRGHTWRERHRRSLQPECRSANAKPQRSGIRARMKRPNKDPHSPQQTARGLAGAFVRVCSDKQAVSMPQPTHGE